MRRAGLVECVDYLPFGDFLPNSTSGPRSGIGCYGQSQAVTQLFTGKERDGETGLDYFGARYFSGAQGRFTGPDEPLLDQDESDPQSWNLYSYVRNNPLRFFDPTGQECVTLDNGTKGDDGQGTFCKDVADANKNKQPDVTVTASPEPITWLQYLGLDFAYNRAVNQQAEIDANARRWDKVPILRGEIPIGPGEAEEAANFLKGIWSSTNKLSAVRNAFAHWLKHGAEFPKLQNAALRRNS